MFLSLFSQWCATRECVNDITCMMNVFFLCVFVVVSVCPFKCKHWLLCARHKKMHKINWRRFMKIIEWYSIFVVSNCMWLDWPQISTRSLSQCTNFIWNHFSFPNSIQWIRGKICLKHNEKKKNADGCYAKSNIRMIRSHGIVCRFFLEKEQTHSLKENK